MKNTALICALLATACSYGTTLFSTSFESAQGYTPGNLHGQNGWDGSLRWSVNSMTARTGTAGVLIDNTLPNSVAGSYMTVPVTFTPTATATKAVIRWAANVFQGVGEGNFTRQLTGIYVGSTNGAYFWYTMGSDQGQHYFEEHDSLFSTGNFSYGPAQLTRGVYHEFQVTIDFALHKLFLSVDGIDQGIAANYPGDDMGELDMYGERTAGYNMATSWIDDVSVVSLGTKHVTGKVFLGNSTAGIGGRSVAVTIRLANGTVIETQNLTTDSSGMIDMQAVAPDGTYNIYAKSETGLSRKIGSNAVLTDGSTFSFLDTTLVNGDVNKDDTINLLDFSLLSNAYGSSTGGAQWNASADLNQDGTVNLVDFSILSSNYGRTGDLLTPNI